MPGALLWAWDKDAKVFRKVLVDAYGKLIISDADPFEITQTTPEDLRHVPHGYYPTGGTYLPLQVDSAGKLLLVLAGEVPVITFIIDGGGLAITTGEKGHLRIPFACTIERVTMLADQSGSIVVDIWKDTYANFPPTVADTITAADKPTITTAQKSENSTLTGWTTAIAADDILAFNVDSVTDIERVTISLKVVRT